MMPSSSHLPTPLMWLTEAVVSSMEMSTCCPSPLAELWWSAIMLLTAANDEAITCAWEPASLTGGSSSSPVTYIAPPSALATMSEDLKSRCGPVCPKPDIDASTRRGLTRFKAV
jgi:hypothetical protein